MMATASKRQVKTKFHVVKVPQEKREYTGSTVFIAPKPSASEQFRYVQVNEFQPNVDGWNLFGDVTEYEQTDQRTLVVRNAEGFAAQLRFVSPLCFRVKFRPSEKPDYKKYDRSLAVANDKLADVTIQVSLIDKGGQTIKIDTGALEVFVGCHPYGMAVYKNGELVTEDSYGKNLIFSNDATACLRKAPVYENYYGFGEKAGIHLNKKNYTLSFFNYDNFTYEGTTVIPADNQPGPLNPSEPLYNSIPFLLAVGKAPQLYSYGLFLDNISQTFFNLGSNDYSDMSGKYYFGALYSDLTYYVMVGEATAENRNNPVRSVLNQYSQLTGRSAMPPKYAFGYQQGCYGYYDRNRLMTVAREFREASIPIDGLHIDVDFQNNYRTFTSSPKKFPNPEQMFEELHNMGYKCSTNITGIVSANPLDEDGNRDTPYPTRDSIVTITDSNQIEVKSDVMVPFIYNTRAFRGESPDLFIANESYGTNVNNFNPYKYPTPMFPNGQESLGTYGFYSNMANPEVQQWWGEQYEYLLSIGMDMIWQDMTDPAVVPNFDNETPDKTLPLNLMVYDKITDSYQPEAKVHNSFALNLIQSTYNGLTKLRHDDKFKGTYNYQKRNFIIARGAYAGVHRYAGVWTGDSASSWDFLKINIPEVLNFGLSGQPISGCDIGGFANGSGSEADGVTNYQLFTRWMTMGALLPWYRNHYDGYTKSFQEPYKYGEPVPSHCRKYIEIRYRLIQLFYDTMYQNTQTGLPIARALFVNDPNDSNVYEHVNDQYFIGEDLLIAPVVEAFADRRDVYLPSGNQWYVYSDNTAPLLEPTPGGTTQNWYVPLDLVPMYVREGAILPHRELEQYVGELDVNPITYNIYPGKDASYACYQDDQTTTANSKQNAYRLTTVSHRGIPSGQQVKIVRQYDHYTPPEPFYFISFLGTVAPKTVEVEGKPLSDAVTPDALYTSSENAYYYNDAIRTTFIKIFDKQASCELNVTW